MLAEIITVTSSTTSIIDLIATARGVQASTPPSKCTGFTIWYGSTETEKVYISDEGSTSAVMVLDASGEDSVSASFDQFGIDKVFLSCDTGTVDVNIVVSQKLV